MQEPHTPPYRTPRKEPCAISPPPPLAQHTHTGIPCLMQAQAPHSSPIAPLLNPVGYPSDLCPIPIDPSIQHRVLGLMPDRLLSGSRSDPPLLYILLYLLLSLHLALFLCLSASLPLSGFLPFLPFRFSYIIYFIFSLLCCPFSILVASICTLCSPCSLFSLFSLLTLFPLFSLFFSSSSTTY